MALNREEIRILMIEKLAGTIEPADLILLNQLIHDEPEAHEMWMELCAELQDAEANGFELAVNDSGKWMQLEPQLIQHRTSKIKQLGKRLMVAASILAIMTVGYFWFQRDQSASAAIVSTISLDKIKVPTLQFADQRVLELTGKEIQTVKVGDAELILDAKSLRYINTARTQQQWTIFIPAGYDYKVQLADGSEVWLNAATTLKFPSSFSDNTRDISIDGEAYFKVAKNKNQPFIVHTSATDVIVTGTEFNINTYSADKIQTSLVEGSVTLRSKFNKELALKPGFEAVLLNELQFEKRAFDSLEVLSWMKGVYYFRNKPLRELSSVIKRWYNVDSEFATEFVQNKMFSGELRKDQPLQAFVENLSLSGNVEGKLAGGVIRFK